MAKEILTTPAGVALIRVKQKPGNICRNCYFFHCNDKTPCYRPLYNKYSASKTKYYCSKIVFGKHMDFIFKLAFEYHPFSKT